MKQIRLGSGSGFWGDGFDPAMEVLEKGQLDYLCFDFLAELTMALLQRQKLKNPNAGFIPDAVQFMKAMMPTAHEQGTRLISNGGGVNPMAAGQQMLADARALGLQGLKVGVVQGDDLLAQIAQLRADGVPAAAVIGWCAASLGLIDRPRALEPREFLARATPDALRAAMPALRARPSVFGADDPRSLGSLG